MLSYLSDSATVDYCLAVHPSVWTGILSQVLCRRDAAAWVAVVYRPIKVPGFRIRAAAVIRWSVACEDARHHMEGKEDLWKTNQYIQNLLIPPKPVDLRQDLIEIHFNPHSNSVLKPDT